ncbi:S-layer homology domain-containing protein [Bacillus thermotolerans]|uniref:SLH domain-containing protein n=1 Tax=Bacillus thermotolerans TaxID=1221996 RepID=A0A0F5I703_BACTR|nr:S-layer homology domain-containing protein [Bacillus thermotolerans]KKB40957.1 hypothetical protein QY95_01020 [Bacillus thermotolerans]
MALKAKSYHKFIASSAAVALVATAVSPASAAFPFTDVSDRYKEAVTYLVEEDITNGITKTQFGTSSTIKRVDAAVMIAKALKLDTTNVPDSGFTDVPDRAKAHVDALKAAGFINGKTATSFGSSQDITRGEMALILAKAYQLSGDTNDIAFTDVASRYKEAVAALVANEVTFGKTDTSFGTTDSITRGEFALFLHRLADEAEVPAPEVTGVEGLNANQIAVQFNTEMNAEQAKNTSLYSLNGTAPAKAELASDKKSIVLTFNSVEGKDQVLVVNPIESLQKGKDGESLKTEKFTKVFSYKDTVKPAVKSTSYSNGTITVEFTEALSTIPTVARVNGESVTAEEGEDAMKVEIAYDLEPSESASLYLAGAEDQANEKNEMDLYKGTVTAPAKDTNRPYVTGVEVTGQNTAKVTLSENITLNKIDAILQRGATQTDVVLKEDTKDESGRTYTLDVDLGTDEMFKGDSTKETFTLYVKEGKMTDDSGDTNEEYKTELTFEKDTEAPKLVSAQVSADGEKFEFTFDEALEVEGADPAIDVRDADNVKWNVIDGETGVKTGELNTYQVDIKADAEGGDNKLEPGSYSVTIPANFFTDQYDNATAEVTHTFVVGEEEVVTEEDTEKPRATVESAGNVFTVTFDEEVTTSATDLKNYRLDGEALPEGTDIYFNGPSKEVVVITLPAGSVNIGKKGEGVPAILTVSDVSDKAGNVINKVNLEVDIEDNTPATITKVEELNKNVVVTFSEDVILKTAAGIEAVDPAKVFEIKVDGETVTAKDLREVTDKPNQLQFTLDNALDGKLTVEVKDDQEALTDENGVVVK